MASSKVMTTLLFAFAVVVAATLPPTAVASRPQQGFEQTAADKSRHEAPPAEPLLHPTAASNGAAGLPGTPALPGLPPLPAPGLGALIGGLLFPPFGGLIGGLLFPPQQPATGPPPTECMTSLVGLLPCANYLTNLTVLTPPGQCCDGLKSAIRDAPICLCHATNGDLNSFLPRPIDPVRMSVLPLACGTMLPLQTLLMCSSSQVPPIMPSVPARMSTTPATPSVSP